MRGLTELVGHPGAAIIALAVSVKILLLPLTAIAERLQEQVNVTQARLQPGLDAIKAAYCGKERTRGGISIYTFPASMVLYWTSTNSFQHLSQSSGGYGAGRECDTLNEA